MRRLGTILIRAAAPIAVLGLVGSAWMEPVSATGEVRPGDAGYESGSAAAKQECIYRAVVSTTYTTLPKIGSAGVGDAFKDTIGALRLGQLAKTFKEATDARCARTKIFHPFGAVATVSYEPAMATEGLAQGLLGAKAPATPVPAHPYTGFFKTGGLGIARLSLATDEKTFIPGIALKLLVDGKPSVNIHAIPSFDGQTGRDFFERAPSNSIPTPSNFVIKLLTKLFAFVANPLYRSVAPIAAIEPNGSVVAAPRAPYQIFFRAADVHFDPAATTDFRDELASIPPGTVIYQVYAREKDSTTEVHIGDVRTTSRFVASSFGDRELHFEHVK
jgi:hypothetical protein